MSLNLIARLHSQLEQIRLIDPHTHINPHAPASQTLADILGYHYYTELAHSAGMPRDQIEQPGLTPKDRVARLVSWLPTIENTVQFDWLLEICREFFGFDEGTINTGNWESLYDRSALAMGQPDWEASVLVRSRLDGVFLTNEFDDPLTGFDTRFYIPCLRVDDLVFRLAQPAIRDRLAAATGSGAEDCRSLDTAIDWIFDHFCRNGARACAISLPPDFAPSSVSELSVEPLLAAIRSGRALSNAENRVLSQFVFWRLAERCADFGLPFDLMIGVNRRVYDAGVYQGQDLFDGRVSLIQYQRLFNHFATVKFPVSVLSHGLNQELVSYAWIFPNVITNGHWWYSNLPAYIELDCRSRLQAVPWEKQIGYYSDMYKLEFALPKFSMYRRVLARVLAVDFVLGRAWTEDRALELGRAVLRGNVERLFPESRGASRRAPIAGKARHP